jgi:hypothetical protein
MLSTTVPVPVPVLPARIVMNDDEVVAVQVQALVVVTVTVAVPPEGPTLDFAADNAYVHAAAGVLVVVPVVVVVVALGVAGVESLEHAAALKATARNPSRERSLTDEFTRTISQPGRSESSCVARPVHFCTAPIEAQVVQ